MVAEQLGEGFSLEDWTCPCCVGAVGAFWGIGARRCAIFTMVLEDFEISVVIVVKVYIQRPKIAPIKPGRLFTSRKLSFTIGESPERRG